MAEDQNNGLTLKSRSGYTGKLFLPSTADIATLNTAQAAVNSIDPTARFIVSSTEPETADDGKIWITVEGGVREYVTESITIVNDNGAVATDVDFTGTNFADFTLQNIVAGTNVVLTGNLANMPTLAMIYCYLGDTDLCFSEADTSIPIARQITYRDDLKTVTALTQYNKAYNFLIPITIATTNSATDDASCIFCLNCNTSVTFYSLKLTYTHYV